MKYSFQEIKMKRDPRYQVLVYGAAIALLAPCATSAQTISSAAAAQIGDILSAKQQFTAAQRKMDSSLVFAAKKSRGELANTSYANSIASPSSADGGLVIVDINGNVPQIVSLVAAAGGQVLSQFPVYNTVHAALPLLGTETVANSPFVDSVAEWHKAMNNVGALTSQALISHGADQVIKTGVTGAGVKVGVLSDSASAARVAALIASGDLPANTTVLAGQAGTGEDEGAAMMEIIHDIAPGAQLFFATANPTPAQFATNITALANQGCSIIVDDITYANEPPFQDGIIQQAINTFVNNGGIYFSSAANSGSLTNGSGTWEGDFVDGGPITGAISTAEGGTGRLHKFGTQTFNTLTSGGSAITLQWSDPAGASANDYDIFILNSAGTTIKASSLGTQTGTQDPFEAVFTDPNCSAGTATGYCPAAGDQIVVVQFSGSARALRINTNRGRLSAGTTGSTFGHNAGGSTVSVAATFWNSAKTGVKAFTGVANPVEFFSSDGPRKIFYNPNGTAITPGNVLFGTNGGTTLQKPDITASDGISTKTPGFLPFFGTSAAAPHAAAIAALVKSAKPSLTGAQIKTILINTALDNMSAGWDRDGGFGIVMAQAAVQAALAQ